MASLGAGPGDNMEFKYQQHKANDKCKKKVIKDVDEAFKQTVWQKIWRNGRGIIAVMMQK